MNPQPPAAAPGGNPLATAKISSLIRKFALPSIFGMLVTSLYNFVDQIFIGQGIGMLGNGATNVAFPLSIFATGVALLLGIGTASNNNLNQGRGRPDLASHQVANGISLVIVCGVLIAVFGSIFLEQLVWAFGATEDNAPYAIEYMRIIVPGLPLVIFSTAGSHLIRSDGSPTYSMICLISGAVINTILDPIFIFVFGWGMAGAAWATVIGQCVTMLLAARYLFFKMQTVQLQKSYFKLHVPYVKAILSLGSASFLNQFVMMIVQIVLNNTLRYYGADSVYGSDIPLAVVGVISKVNMIFMSFCIGIAQGCQPIFGFNYGARNYGRVKEAYKKALQTTIAISVVFFLCFQLFPRQIVSVFGEGSELYFQFAERFFRIYMMMCFISCIQPMTATFFTSIGKAKYGIFMSLTRQGIFLLPLILIFPIFLGIDGIMYAAPIADFFSVALALVFLVREFRLMTKQELTWTAQA